MLEKTIKIFEKIFGDSADTHVFFSPGRVNLIGEHIDYNGGYVFPAAITLGNYGVVKIRKGRTIRLYSGNFPDLGVIEVSLDDLDYRSRHAWGNYAKGIVREFMVRNLRIRNGFDLVIFGDLISGAGLSSSASIELLVATIINTLFGFSLSTTELALLAKFVENEYMHVNCGIMDQFVIANGKKGHALLLNTQTLDYREIELNLGEYDIVICNSMKKRGLVDSKYNIRKEECERALSILSEYTDHKTLADIPYPEFVNLEEKLDDPVLASRVRHVITENTRTLNAYNQLMANDLEGFGKSLLASHYSLKNDYAVSSDELDFLVELAMKYGSLGSKMTGAGFGGCTVNIVKHSDFEKFKENVQSEYKKRFNVIPDVLIANPEDGAKEITR